MCNVSNFHHDDSKLEINTYQEDGKIKRVIVSIDNIDSYISFEMAVKLHDMLEKTVVNSEYWYDNMQAENDRLQQRILDLEETLDNIGYEEAV